MSALGDRLRQAANQADADTKLTAFAVIVTKNSSFRFFVSHVHHEDEARMLCARGLINTLGIPPEPREEQAADAAVWGKVD